MFPNLIGMKEYESLSGADMAKIIGVSERAYWNKIKSGNFTVTECKALCQFFRLTFEFLFATEEEIREENDKFFEEFR